MAKFKLAWVIAPTVILAEAEVNGKEAVKRQIIEWVNEGFGEDGDQVHITQLPVKKRRES